MILLGTPLKLDLSPGRRVVHVVTTEKSEHRYLYEVVGLAVDAKRVVCLGASGLVLFSLDIFERGFVTIDEPAAPEPDKVAGVYHKGSGV
jgi:hypothetical protein